MGHDISKSIIPPPLTLQDCLVDGQMNIGRYWYYRRRIDNQSFEFVHRQLQKKRKATRTITTDTKRQKRHRSIKRHKLLVGDENGSIRELLPTDTLWYLMYIANPPRDKRMMKLFRLRFRMPYECFIKLSDQLYGHCIFERWTKCDCSGGPPSNTKLLLLGALRYIGRACTFDDICEANGYSAETNIVFLKAL